MARAIRFQYLGACKHVMARGNVGGIEMDFRKADDGASGIGESSDRGG